MKRISIASIVGALILFFWQFLSQAALDLHKNEHQYAPQQDSILSALAGSGLKEGKYVMPMADPSLGYEAQMKHAEDNIGKPMVILDYQKARKADMGMNMLRGVLVNILIMVIFISFLTKTNTTAFKTIFSAALGVGLIGFLNHAYTNYIWYHSSDIYIDLLDALAGWGLSGLWLAFYLKK